MATYTATFQAMAAATADAWAIQDALLLEVETTDAGIVVRGQFEEIARQAEEQGVGSYKPGTLRDYHRTAHWLSYCPREHLTVIRSRPPTAARMAQQAGWTYDRLSRHLANGGATTAIKRNATIVAKTPSDNIVAAIKRLGAALYEASKPNAQPLTEDAAAFISALPGLAREAVDLAEPMQVDIDALLEDLLS